MPEDYERAREAALKILERRRRTRADLAKRLAEKGHSGQTIAEVCDRLEELKLLDDLEFARLHIRGRAAKPRGRRLLLQELRAKGIPQAVAEEALSEAEEGENSGAAEGGEA